MTRRQELIHMLEKEKYSAQQITHLFKVELWEIIEDLKHVGRSMYPQLKRTPAECRHCGFIFKERSKIKTPSKCPKCKSHAIVPSLFSIEKK